MQTLDTHKLAERIGQKHQCLVHLRDLARRQMALIAAGDMTQLLKVLSAKQHLIGSLQAIEKDLAPYRHDDPEQRRWPSPADRARCAQQAAACRELLAEIVRAEKSSESGLAERRDEIARRLQVAHVATRARVAYGGPPDPSPGMLDLASES